MGFSTSLVARYLEHCRRAGLDTAALVAGLPISERDLRNRKGTIPWDPWTVLLDRVQDALGGPAAMEEFTAGFFPSQRAMQMIAGLVVDARSLYLVVAARMGRAGYPDLHCSFEQLPDAHIRFEGSIEPGTSGSLPFWYGTIGTLRSYPRLLGLPDAQVEAEIEPHRAVMFITPPASRTLSAQAISLAAPFAPMLRRHLLGEQDLSELIAELEAAEQGSTMLEEAWSAGQRFAKIRDPERLADAVVEWATQRAGCTHVDLTFLGNPRLRRCVCVPVGAVFSRRITVADRVVGRLDWTAGSSDPAGPAALVDAILPWVAIAIEACCPDDLEAHLALARDRWKLTRRQEQVVEMVARGRANKEIAAALGCSTKGVEAHLTVLYRKAGTDSRTGLVARVWEG